MLRHSSFLLKIKITIISPSFLLSLSLPLPLSFSFSLSLSLSLSFPFFLSLRERERERNRERKRDREIEKEREVKRERERGREREWVKGRESCMHAFLIHSVAPWTNHAQTLADKPKFARLHGCTREQKVQQACSKRSSFSQSVSQPVSLHAWLLY